MTALHLLPNNASALERALSESLDRTPFFGPYIDTIAGLKYGPVIPATFSPWVIAEYGLGPISEYFLDDGMLIAAGIRWQRVRGTPLGVAMSLSWIGYPSPEIEDQNDRRRKWNRYQVGMGSVPVSELPVLRDAEYLVGLSDPARSVFIRGWHGYDVRTLEWGDGMWGDSLWGDDSGIRLNGGSVKWSHGEDLVGGVVADGAHRAGLGVDFSLGDELEWGDFPWDAPGISWEGITDVAAFKAFLLRRMPVYVGFYDAGGAAIGYRRPIAVRDMTAFHDAAPDRVFLEVEARTDFADAEGVACASVALVFRAGNADADKPGKLWLAPNEIEFEDGAEAADMTIGAVAADFTFRRTVRQHVTITMEI
ncbi:phage tail protein [Mesorhizobium sp. M0204]|uniref:phage tail protein n=1 Tax=Mesorhizobium sp. M0204 TaxID=2956913 RepID=UPI003336829B